MSFKRTSTITRWAIAACSLLALCSCRSQPRALAPDPMDPQYAPLMSGCPEMMPEPAPLPYNVLPPEAKTLEQRDEYLHDGGDRELPVLVSPEWQVYGLDTQDTVAQFDTLSGETLVTPSNCVNIYAPRFGAVRTVARLAEDEHIVSPGGVVLPEKLARADIVRVPVTNLQRVQLGGEVGSKLPEAYEMGEGGKLLVMMLTPAGFQDTYLPFENLEVIKTGIIEETEKARLAESIQAAIVWTREQAVQVVLDRKNAGITSGNLTAETVYTVKDLRNCPKLKVIKVASTQTAKPGETIDFTIRFDNVGDQPIGNVVLMDSLTTRLEFVAGSAQSSVKAAFSSKPNEGDSVTLRWELAEPLNPGQGGVVRFNCRVR
jgi:uncharacterized repeat protein (TIGR01451 family)